MYYQFAQDHERFKSIIARSSSIKSALDEYGLPTHSQYYQRLRSACAELGISPPSYDYRNNKGPNHKRPLAELLVEKSPATNKAIRNRIVDEGLLKEECSICGLQSEWNNKSLKLHLDHINGVNNDNRIQNLRFLCPNCHSQTSTYAGRNCRNQRNKCEVCNMPVLTKDAKWHLRCFNTYIRKQATKINWPPIEKLKQSVADQGFSATGRELGVSDNAVRKHLQRYDQNEASNLNQ